MSKVSNGNSNPSGQDLWLRAKRVIPGGNMLLSKRAEMFLPELWPTYFSKSKGCYVWDLANKKYIDFSIMGIGTNTLGYGDPDVDRAVSHCVSSGNMSSLNCPEEVFLAERLVGLHPWADMVRFARTGGEANAVAVRIARAAAGRDGVAVCGYHGWHDWYLSANLHDNDALNSHLLSGLDTAGVPKALKGTLKTFSYNDAEQLRKIVSENDVGVIIMEVQRSLPPRDNFLQVVREIATSKNIVLIFDECTSGFRSTFGGIHKIYDVQPDIVVFGKALGNGYGITAIVGKREVMESAQSSFISSTFWTERIGPTAALATLNKMEKIKSWEIISDIGMKIKSIWAQAASANSIDVHVSGIPAIPSFTFTGENQLALKTYFTQQMLENGYLAGTLVYTSVAHSSNLLDLYSQAVNEAFRKIADCQEDKHKLMSMLKGPICHSGFKRLA